MFETSRPNAAHAAATLEALGFHVREDTFSVQLSHSGDARFWIRCTNATPGPTEVTDLFLGTFEPDFVARLLDAAIQLTRTNPNELHFRDITAGMPGKMATYDADLHAVAGQYAKRRRMFLVRWEAFQKSGKHHIAASFRS